jgi:uncharacterized protein YjdB
MFKNIKTVLAISLAFLFISFLGYTAIAETQNAASGKSITSSKAFKNSSFITDNDKNTENYADSYPNKGVQWVQIDLGAPYNINNIKLWHYFGDARKYHDVIVQLSNSSTFSTGITTVFNNDTNNSARRGKGTDSEYAESSSGLNITFNTVNARYARFYSNGCTANDWNHYVEIAIYTSDSVTVVHPTSVTLDKSNDTLTLGGTDTLNAKVLPEDATNKNVTWLSSAQSVATISSTGATTALVTGVGVGTATITATTVDGGKIASCEVVVSKKHAQLLFTFDDRPKCDLTIAAPILNEKGFVGTAYVTKNIVPETWAPDIMTESDLQTLYSNYGWDLANHSSNHTFLSSNNKNYVSIYTQEYLDTQNWLISKGWTRSAYHVAYAYGTYTDPLIDSLSNIGVKTARTCIQGLEQNPPTNPYILKDIDVMEGVDYVKNKIDSAIDSKSTIILMMHGLGSTSGDWVMSTSDFQAIVDYVYQKTQQNELEVTTISKWYNSSN